MSLAIYEIYNTPEETSEGKFDPEFIFTPSQVFSVIKQVGCIYGNYEFDQAGIVNLFGYAMTDTADAINAASKKYEQANPPTMLMRDLKHNGNLLLELADYALRTNGKNKLLGNELVSDIIFSTDRLLANSWTAHRYNVRVFEELSNNLHELTNENLAVRRDDK